MKTIVFVNRFFYPDHSATSQILSDLVFDVANEDLRIEIVTSRLLYSDPTVQLPVSDTVNGVKINRVWTSRFGRGNLIGRAFDYFTFYTSALIFLLFSMKKVDAIIVKTDPPLISVIVMMVSRVRKIPYINWIQDLFPEVASELGIKGMSLLSPMLVYVRNKSLNHAVANVVISNSMKSRLLDNKVSEASIRVIHNWSIENAIKPVDQSDNELRAEWGMEDDFIVGYSGNMGKSHEFDTVLSAAGRFSNIKNIIFLFIGEGAQKSYIMQKSRELRLENIVFKPYQPAEKLKYSLTLPDLHVISLRPELEGLVVPSKFYGIIASGRPVLYIGDSSGDIARIIQENACGRACAIGSADEVVDYIQTLRSDHVAADQAGEMSRKLYDREFSKNVPHARWAELIDEVL